MRQPPIPFRRLLARRAFTLLEVLVVMTIIIIIAVAAMPAMRFITGSRSIEGTQNVAGAMIARARTTAVLDHQVRGVFFFLDPVTDRTTMALVRQDGDNTQNPDLDAYKSWTDGQDIFPKQGVTYRDDLDLTVGPSFANTLTILNTTEVFNFGAKPPKPTLQMFKCLQTHTPARLTTNSPTSAAHATFWGLATPLFLEIYPNTDLQILPAGVGVQLVNDPQGNTAKERYYRTGVILFDGKGAFTSVQYDVTPNSKLGKALGLAANKTLENQTFNPVTGTATATPASYGLYSQFGLAIYDRQIYLAQSTKSGQKFTEGDFAMALALPTYPPPAASAADEVDKETWLDSNALPLLVNRYNGTLIKGE